MSSGREDGVIQEVAVASIFLMSGLRKRESVVDRLFSSTWLTVWLLMAYTFHTLAMSSAEDVEMEDSSNNNNPTQELSIGPPGNMQTKTEPEPDQDDHEHPRFQLRFLLSGHKRAVSCLKFSPDGVYLASSCMFKHSPKLYDTLATDRAWRKASDKTVKIWETETGQFVQTFEGHTEGISDVSWSSDGEYLASASDDKTIIIWSMEDVSHSATSLKLSIAHILLQREPFKTLSGHTNFVFCVNFNPDTNLLVSGGYDETIRVWDVARGMPFTTCSLHDCSFFFRSTAQGSSCTFRPGDCGQLQPRRFFDCFLRHGRTNVCSTFVCMLPSLMQWQTNMGCRLRSMLEDLG